MLRMSDCSWCRTMFIAELFFEACLMEPCLYEPPMRHVSLCSEKNPMSLLVSISRGGEAVGVEKMV